MNDDIYAVVVASVDEGVLELRFWLNEGDARDDYQKAEAEWGDGGMHYHVSLYQGLPGQEAREILGPVPEESNDEPTLQHGHEDRRG